MPYSKTTWVDRVVQYPNRYSKSGETSTEVTLVQSAGTVTASGTPVNAANLNKIEDGIANALEKTGDTMTGVLNVIAGTVTAPAIAPTGDSNTGIFFPAADTVAIGEGGTEVLRINSAGNVGIGTTNPTQKLHVSGNSILGANNQSVNQMLGVPQRTDTRTTNLAYTSGVLTGVTETDGATTVKSTTLNYSSGNLSTVVEVVGGRTITTTLNYTSGVLTSVSRAVV